MGIEILSFTIRDVSDNVEYLSSLGRAQTAVVIKNADIAKAEAERDATIRNKACFRVNVLIVIQQLYNLYKQCDIYLQKQYKM
ncbi:FLOT2 [Bugula neritina]|uniref:FLOT2 n=1 Tax=Bugula neritina TaxID=10212 RepID=A0A7J7K0X9_BUGNE|nr:FLOT2 [Bugula neritina]